MQLKVKRLHPTVPLPRYGREGDAALDLHACIDTPVTLNPGERTDIGCGLAFAIPAGHVGLVMPRGGLGRKGLSMANTVGVIDSNYRGEIFMLLVNNGLEPITIAPMDRVMQMAIVPVPAMEVEEVADLDETNRGEGRFSSSGISGGTSAH